MSWRRSSRCENESCVEVQFVKSSRSELTNCVEVASCDCCVRVRDSKDQSGPFLTFPHDAWTSFVGGVKAGEFDD